jgi:large subunit ribosomal protein L18e
VIATRKIMKKPSISKTALKSRFRKKNSPAIAATLIVLSKNPAWMKYARFLSQSTRKHSSVNLREIDKQTSMGDTVMVPGRVLSIGDMTKKVKICSFGISGQALEKLKKTKSAWCSILDEIKSNPRAEGLKVIK